MNKHSGMSKGDFESKYQKKAPWDIGRPQKVFADRFAEVLPQSPVLEIGCGNGDLALFLASKGCNVLGIDFSREAINKAKAKAKDAGSNVSFEVLDAFSLPKLGKRFKTIVDCCFFHVLDDNSRKEYEQVLQEIIEPTGMIYMLCFAVRLAHPEAPRAISKQDIEQTFGDGWTIVSIEPGIVEITLAPQALSGIFAVLKRNAL
jgi:cyclopropane fatty-acyl-phospholipid synthase-like methyltransferase